MVVSSFIVLVTFNLPTLSSHPWKGKIEAYLVCLAASRVCHIVGSDIWGCLAYRFVVRWNLYCSVCSDIFQVVLSYSICVLEGFTLFLCKQKRRRCITYWVQITQASPNALTEWTTGCNVPTPVKVMNMFRNVTKQTYTPKQDKSISCRRSSVT